MEEKITYFETCGIENTVATIELSRERALKREIKNIVLASTRGYTAEIALNIFKDTNCHLIIIPHEFGS